MITNLFRVFDPTSSFIIINNWFSIVLFILFLRPIFWTLQPKFIILIYFIKNLLFKEFKALTGRESSTLIILIISLILFIIMNNVIGLFPYIFTATRHLSLTLALSLPIWVSLILFGWIKNTFHIFSHLVPQRTPGPLIPFIVLIETIRNVIRPGTLAVRLSANIIAGHLLITLLGNQTALARKFILISLIFTQIILLTLEIAVAIIQSYVFAILSTLYTREIVSH